MAESVLLAYANRLMGRPSLYKQLKSVPIIAPCSRSNNLLLDGFQFDDFLRLAA